MKKRGLKININFSNRWLYALVTLGILILVAASVFALTAGTTPNPGHNLSEIGVPSGCLAGSALMWDGTSLACGNNYLWDSIAYPPMVGMQESLASIKTRTIALPSWNMQAVSQITLDYSTGINWNQVMRVSVIIYSDDSYSDPNISPRAVDLEQGGNWALGPASTTKLVLTRTAGGIFDSPDFNYAYPGATRGRVVIEYY